MNIKFIIPGKDKKSYIEEGINEYIKRLNKYTKVNLIYTKEEIINDANKKNIALALEKDANNILSIVKNDFLILLDIHAQELSSQELVNSFNKIISKNGNISFVIGSSYGLSNTLRNRANFSLSLSKLTFTHYFSLLILVEQVYRCFKILNNETYDK